MLSSERNWGTQSKAATPNHIGGLWKIEQKVNFGFLSARLVLLWKITHTQQSGAWPLVPFAKGWGGTAERYWPYSRVSGVTQAEEITMPVSVKCASWDWEILDLLKYKQEVLSLPQQSFSEMFMNFSLPVGSLKYHHTKFSKYLRLFEVAVKSAHEVQHL